MKKKFIIVANTFYPDRNSASKLLEELSVNLEKDKNDVLIVCARSNKKNKEFSKFGRVKVINVYCKNIKSLNLYKRGIAELFISRKMILASNSYLQKYKPNHIICYSPPIFFKGYISFLKRTYSCKSLLILRDLFPYWTISTKIINNFLISLFLINIFKSFVKIFDTVGVEAKSNIQYLKNKKLFLKNLIYLPNWIEPNRRSINKKNKFVESVVFGGNIGLGQDIKKVCNFFNNISHSKLNISFKIIGTGNTKNLIYSNLNKNVLKKIKIYKSLDPNSYDKEVKNSSYGIVSLDDRIKSINFPGRMLNYIKLGLPVILLTDKKNELTKFIIKNKVGIVIGNKTNIFNEFKKLKAIKNKFILNNYNNRIILKYFNINKTIQKIYQNFEK